MPASPGSESLVLVPQVRHRNDAPGINTFEGHDVRTGVDGVSGVGVGGTGFGDGGEARKATFSGPKHLCIDGSDNVIIADTDNHAIRKYFPKENRVVLVAGTGKSGSGGAGGPLSGLELNQPHGVCVDKSGALCIADSLNNRVLKIER